MCAKIRFDIYESESTFLHPGKGFSPVTESFQVRVDPLTGRTGHFSHFGAVRQLKLPLEDYLKPEVKGFCPFCKENRDRTTPKFVKEILPSGRAARNEATLIPNLFPYDIYSGVIIMTDEHVVPLERFDERKLTDSFALGIEFLKRIKSIEPGLPYHIMSWNYMPPSGGGLVHPHQQYFATERPGNQFMDEIKASVKFRETHELSYWPELIKEEKKNGQRYIGRIGSSEWITSFVSLGILGEIMCIFPEVFAVDDFTDGHINELASGLLNIFKYYQSIDIFSFNASLFFGPENQKSFSCHFRIIPRTFLNKRDFAPDLNFFQALLSEPISVVLPEKLCEDVRKYFHS